MKSDFWPSVYLWFDGFLDLLIIRSQIVWKGGEMMPSSSSTTLEVKTPLNPAPGQCSTTANSSKPVAAAEQIALKLAHIHDICAMIEDVATAIVHHTVCGFPSNRILGDEGTLNLDFKIAGQCFIHDHFVESVPFMQAYHRGSIQSLLIGMSVRIILRSLVNRGVSTRWIRLELLKLQALEN